MDETSRAQQLMGDIAPKLAELTDEVLFGDVWARPGLSPRDRSLVTVAALATAGNTEQLTMLRAAAARCCGRRPAPEVRTAGCRHRG